ncbi:AzlD domain-containing protein, partial [Enterococcus faecium]
WFSSLFTQNIGHLPQINLENALASVPTLLAAILSKSLLVIVLVGILSLSLIRLL